MITKYLKNKIRVSIFPFLGILLVPSILSAVVDIPPLEVINKRAEDAGYGTNFFKLNEDGEIIQTNQGDLAPPFAIEAVAKSLGLPTSFMFPQNPFKIYSKSELVGEDFSHWLKSCRRTCWREGSSLGYGWTQSVVSCQGNDVFEKYKEYKDRQAWWLTFFRETIPMGLKSLLAPKPVALAVIAVLVLIVMPMLIYQITNAVLKYIYARRPTILGPGDTDIYTSWWQRWRFKHPELPEVICNAKLQTTLDKLVLKNTDIASQRAPFPHILAFGEPGVGKTLFAKYLAKESGMHFVYMTMSDIEQLPKEEALEEFKKIFAYSRNHGPTLIIIDEADVLSTMQNSKEFIGIIQKEFASSSDSKIQLFLISNYPKMLPSPLVSRIAHLIKFDKPSIATLRRLFELHLGRALGRSNVSDLVQSLPASAIKGLVGRDVEAIARAFAFEKAQTPATLLAAVKAFKAQRRAFAEFELVTKTASKVDPNPHQSHPSKQEWS